MKKASPTVVNHVENLKDHSGKLVNAQSLLKLAKKPYPTGIICDVSKDHSGKLTIAQFALKPLKKLSPGFVPLAQKPSESDGIYITFTLDTVASAAHIK